MHRWKEFLLAIRRCEMNKEEPEVFKLLNDAIERSIYSWRKVIYSYSFSHETSKLILF
ncbi:MAG: hypothetical protein M3421_05570 [Bacteroidota bacterium]|nr:hypothetical protein [Bacteroidota bacterium]